MDNQSLQPAREYSRQASRDHSKQHNGDINIHFGYASELQSELVAIHETLRSLNLSNPRVRLGSPTSTPSNEHFSLPQPVERDYPGRTSILEDVRNAFNAPACSDQHQIQRRIVIYGVGGSGKTQFCCKYAQMYRQSYWGIFWINASSDRLAKQTFQDISKVEKVDESVRGAKHWLSNLKTQWLLIVDNADDPELELTDYLPEGERGHVLITTRVPSNKHLGTVGPRSFHFQGLKHDEANTLLLKTASRPAPWDSITQKLAASITEALGFLPLALMHAGKAIMNQLRGLDEYLEYHEVENRKFVKLETFRVSDKSKRTIEAQDAVQLLQMFSFFHHENIRLEFLTKAATNPAIERKEQDAEKTREDANRSSQERKSWSFTFKGFVLQIGMFLYKERTPPVLPDAIRDGAAFEREGVFRLKAALKELTQLSLITYNEMNDSYSMHPVVHAWARERPEFRTIEQAVWCQAATTTLAQCILLPPLASTEADERLRHYLLPHIDHVRERYKDIDQEIKRNRQRCKTSWLYNSVTVTSTQIGQMARFSRVYAQGGKWKEALELRLEVKDFCLKKLGPYHTSTMMIKLALSNTYWQLGQGNIAAELQEQVLIAYRTSVGEKDKRTFKAMDILGESRWQQGRLTDSFKLHEKAYNGMKTALGPGHEDTLKAVNNLGRAFAALWQPEQARAHLQKAVNGMKRNANLGPTHLNTLTAMNDLAMTYMANEGGMDSTAIQLEQARQLMAVVHSKREENLGKEHPYTLWAVANLARVKAAMGDLEEAEADLQAGLLIGERTLGGQHLGTLFGKLHLGDTLLKSERYQEAEELLIEVAESHQRLTVANNGESPDRCKALSDLSKCYRLQGRMEEAIEKCQEAIHGMEVLGGHTHPFMKQLQTQHEELIKLRSAARAEPASSDEQEEQPSIVKKAATFIRSNLDPKALLLWWKSCFTIYT